MRDPIARRGFVGLLGAAGIAGTAGCLGGWDDASDDGPGDGSPSDSDGDPDAFDFPRGADDSGADGETIVSVARDVLARTDRYRIVQSHEIGLGDADSAGVEATYAVDGETVHETQRRSDVEVEQWVTRDGTVARSDEVDGDRSGRWVAAADGAMTGSSRDFHLYPFEATAVATLLESARYDFDGIVSRDGRQYARYEGLVDRPERVALPRWTDARVGYALESVDEGTVSMLLAESGGLGAVEYDLAGEVVRQTHEDRRTAAGTASGEVRFADGDLDALSTPSWAAEPDPARFTEFAIRTLGGPGRVYEMTDGPPLPGWSETEYAELYVAATVGDDRFVDRYRRSDEFEVGDRLYVSYRPDDGVLSVNSSGISGRNALENADRVELSVYLWNARDGRVPIYHDEFYPTDP